MRVLKDHKDLQVHKGLKEPQELRDLKVPKVQEAHKGQQDFKEHKDPQDRQVHKGLKEDKVLKVL
jgi:hypothetical protein